MNCTKCGKPIKFIKKENGKMMPVDELMVYVVPDDKARLLAVTHTGYTYKARLANAGDRDARKVFLPHWANCKKHTPNHVEAARYEYDRRQDAILDSQIQKRQKKYAAARMPVKQPFQDDSEQLALF